MSTTLCRESLCWTRGWGARVLERNYMELCQKSPCILYAQTFCTATIICSKHSNQSIISSRKRTYKTWMHHHNFGLAINISKELAVTSHLHPDGTFVSLATLFLMDLKRKPTQAMWLQFRTCFHLDSLLQKNVQKMEKNRKTKQNLDNLPTFPHSLSAPPF